MIEYPATLRKMRYVGDTNYKNAIIYRYSGERGWRVDMPWNLGSPKSASPDYTTLKDAKAAVNDANR